MATLETRREPAWSKTRKKRRQEFRQYGIPHLAPAFTSKTIGAPSSTADRAGAGGKIQAARWPLVTAFPAPTNYSSPEWINRRLAGAMSIPEADIPAFHRILMDIRRLQHADENFAIEDRSAAGAWDRAFAVYEVLRDRAAAEEHRVVQRSQASLDDERMWSEYVENIETVKAMLQRGILDRDTLTEHLDLKLPDDLASPTPAPQIVRQHENSCLTMQTLKSSDCNCGRRATEGTSPTGSARIIAPSVGGLDHRACLPHYTGSGP